MRPCPHCAALEAEAARLTAEKEHATRCCLGQLDAKLAREKELIAARALVRELAAAVRADYQVEQQCGVLASGASSVEVRESRRKTLEMLRRADVEAGEATNDVL